MIVTIVLFLLLRIPSLFEGLWYADEGFYAAGAQSIFDGGRFYIDAWDHKPPIMVWIYMLGGVFGWTLGYPIVKILSVLAGIMSIYLVYLLLDEFKIKQQIQKIALLAFTILIGIPYLEGNVANAELFFMPVNLAIFYLAIKKQYPYLVGIMVLMSFLIKPQAFLEAVVIIFLVFLYKFLKSTIDLKYYMKFILGLGLSSAVFVFYQYMVGTWGEFIDAVFLVNLGYSSGSSYLKLIYLAIAIPLLIWIYMQVKKKQINPETFLLGGIFAFNLFFVGLSGRPYQHYLLQILPVFIILSAYIFSHSKKSIVINLSIVLGLLILVFGYFYQGFGFLKPDFSKEYYVSYYVSFVDYLLGNRDTNIWFWRGHESFAAKNEFLNYFNQEYGGVEYYYYGEDPWIFTELEATDVNKYLVWYHLTFSEDKLQEALSQRDNSLIVVVDKRSPVYLDGFFEDFYEKFTLIDQINDFEIYANNAK